MAENLVIDYSEHKLIDDSNVYFEVALVDEEEQKDYSLALIAYIPISAGSIRNYIGNSIYGFIDINKFIRREDTIYFNGVHCDKYTFSCNSLEEAETLKKNIVDKVNFNIRKNDAEISKEYSTAEKISFVHRDTSLNIITCKDFRFDKFNGVWHCFVYILLPKEKEFNKFVDPLFRREIIPEYITNKDKVSIYLGSNHVVLGSNCFDELCGDNINDDNVIKEVSKIADPNDYLCFVIIEPTTTLQNAELVADKFAFDCVKTLDDLFRKNVDLISSQDSFNITKDVKIDKDTIIHIQNKFAYYSYRNEVFVDVSLFLPADKSTGLLRNDFVDKHYLIGRIQDSTNRKIELVPDVGIKDGEYRRIDLGLVYEEKDLKVKGLIPSDGLVASATHKTDVYTQRLVKDIINMRRYNIERGTVIER